MDSDKGNGLTEYTDTVDSHKGNGLLRTLILWIHTRVMVYRVQ